MSNDIILETKSVADVKGNFNVPSYQRGYRWSKLEVTRLLNDIYQNGKKNNGKKSYCLQPVVVRRKGDIYELIDGQQRLTTLYLIYKYMKNVNSFFSEPAFTLSYDTREQSAEFLKTLDMSKRNDYIDFWFIANAYETIQKWFEQDMQIRVMNIFKYLKEDVKIIWYEVGESEDAISLFTRLNIGKIPLTNAELVRAMFLSRDNAEDMSREKQEEISLQWDSIERELHNESLWYFLTNSVKSEYQTRIDLVLDLISGKEETDREKYYTFFKFDEMRNAVSLDDIWKEIYQTFLILKGWYKNHTLYHKIGYLIASDTSLREIFALSKDKKKTEFDEALDGLIKKSIAISGNYAELSYDTPSDKEKISKLLLLFNVESMRKIDRQAQRFPFDKFKHSKGGNDNEESYVTWSLEHIHAQQSEGMKTQKAWKEWLKLHIPSVKGYVKRSEKSIDGDHSELIDEMQNAEDMKKLAGSVFEDIQRKVFKLFSDNTEYMHSIANLALLNTADNAVLSNSTFDVKRNKIIEMDKKGLYIPFCTKMVFLKYYTSSEDNQHHFYFWGHPDRIAYVKAINEVLADYIEPIILEKEETKMSTTLHSFMDIFETEIIDGDTSVQLNKIVIPRIQRDYAQGRINNDIERVRNRFLDALRNAIIKEPITLDFVYGDIDKKGTMTPLDGQQRLTTLFLLHWYAAKKENISEDKYAFLNKFSYETRYSARYFCEKLVKFTPSFEKEKKLSADIKDQAWFPFDWKNDPTISSMLVMLDAINGHFKGVPDIWSRLESKAITFYFLPIKDMGLTDELYIKMNSRGKPLTLFEHFKAELEREIRILDKKNGQNVANRIIDKIDKAWTDLLWNYHNSDAGDAEDSIIDDEFLRYFKFVCDIICYRNGKSPQSSDVFDLLHLYSSTKDENASENIATLESFFDCWCKINGKPTAFLESFMSNAHQPGKIRVSGKKVDIFEDCIHPPVSGFPLSKMVLLYAITVYLQHQSEVLYVDFVRRIRIVNNLILNSDNEISNRQEKNRIPAIIQAVDAIILTGAIDDSIENNFNVNQIQEEKEKIEFLESHPDKAELVFKLEDHDMLYGQISIIGLDRIDYVDRFYSLFSCELDKIDCALMSIGNYFQKERNKRFYQFASKNHQSAWEKLFHKSANAGFENTKVILAKLLETNQSFDDSTLDTIISAFTAQCENDSVYPWSYYYVKYPIFRDSSYGKMINEENEENKPSYMYSVMNTKERLSKNSYMPYLKEADDAHLSGDKVGPEQCLVYENVYITCKNDSYGVYKNEDDGLVDTITISQNDEGFDAEDRIIKLKNYIANMK